MTRAFHMLLDISRNFSKTFLKNYLKNIQKLLFVTKVAQTLLEKTKTFLGAVFLYLI